MPRGGVLGGDGGTFDQRRGTLGGGCALGGAMAASSPAVIFVYIIYHDHIRMRSYIIYAYTLNPSRASHLERGCLKGTVVRLAQMGYGGQRYRASLGSAGKSGIEAWHVGMGQRLYRACVARKRR